MMGNFHCVPINSHRHVAVLENHLNTHKFSWKYKINKRQDFAGGPGRSRSNIILNRNYLISYGDIFILSPDRDRTEVIMLTPNQVIHAQGDIPHGRHLFC